MILECLLYINYHQYLSNISNREEINIIEKFECNYSGGSLSYLDKIFGTFHDGSEEATQEVMARIKNKRHYL